VFPNTCLRIKSAELKLITDDTQFTLTEGRGFETRGGEWIFSKYLILPAALGPGVYSASNRNGYKKIMFLGSREQPMRRADNLSAIYMCMSRLSRSLTTLQALRPITGIQYILVPAIPNIPHTETDNHTSNLQSHNSVCTSICSETGQFLGSTLQIMARVKLLRVRRPRDRNSITWKGKILLHFAQMVSRPTHSLSNGYRGPYP
jgi:hypothetical protein